MRRAGLPAWAAALVVALIGGVVLVAGSPSGATMNPVELPGWPAANESPMSPSPADCPVPTAAGAACPVPTVP